MSSEVQSFIKFDLQIKLFKFLNFIYRLVIVKRILRERIVFFYQNSSIFTDYLISSKQSKISKKLFYHKK